MKITWTPTARQALSQIRSSHFTPAETAQYKRSLVIEIEQAILLLGSTVPAHEPEWQGNYRLLVVNYKVYYPISSDAGKVHIKHLKHSRRE